MPLLLLGEKMIIWVKVGGPCVTSNLFGLILSQFGILNFHKRSKRDTENGMLIVYHFIII